MYLSRFVTAFACRAIIFTAFFSTSNAIPPRPHTVQTEVVTRPSPIRNAPKPIAPVSAKIEGLTVSSNTSTVAAKVAVSYTSEYFP
jgi:hypothetical protein